MEKREKVNILLVDDDPKKILTIKSILDNPNLNWVECNSGREALRVLLKKEFALILLDVKMPDMDGFETAELIRERPQTEFIPIIFITAYDSDSIEMEKGYSYGAVDFIFTPIKPVVLQTKVQAFVELFKKNRKIERQRDELEQLRDHLEDLVEKRTSALENEIEERKKAEKKLKNSLKEKEVLLAEVHHRVKNNMAVVSALLEFEMHKLKEDKLKGLLANSLSRIRSMALIHEKLYQADNFTHLNFNNYIEDLIYKISSSYDTKHKEITTEIEAEDVQLNLNQAIPCALSLNELLINAYSHAFNGKEKGEIHVRLSEQDEHVVLKVRDNGVGLPEDFKLGGNLSSLGLNLVARWAKQLDAQFNYQNKNGTSFIINFPKAT